MKSAHRHAADILTLSPWIAAQRLSQLPGNPYGLESLLAWQHLALEKWWSAWEAGAGAMGAMIGAVPGAAAQERIAAAMLAPIARQVHANARALRRRAAKKR